MLTQILNKEAINQIPNDRNEQPRMQLADQHLKVASPPVRDTHLPYIIEETGYIEPTLKADAICLRTESPQSRLWEAVTSWIGTLTPRNFLGHEGAENNNLKSPCTKGSTAPGLDLLPTKSTPDACSKISKPNITVEDLKALATDASNYGSTAYKKNKLRLHNQVSQFSAYLDRMKQETKAAFDNHEKILEKDERYFFRANLKHYRQIGIGYILTIPPILAIGLGLTALGTALSGGTILPIVAAALGAFASWAINDCIVYPARKGVFEVNAKDAIKAEIQSLRHKPIIDENGKKSRYEEIQTFKSKMAHMADELQNELTKYGNLSAKEMGAHITEAYNRCPTNANKKAILLSALDIAKSSIDARYKAIMGSPNIYDMAGRVITQGCGGIFKLKPTTPSSTTNTDIMHARSLEHSEQEIAKYFHNKNNKMQRKIERMIWSHHVHQRPKQLAYNTIKRLQELGFIGKIKSDLVFRQLARGVQPVEALDKRACRIKQGMDDSDFKNFCDADWYFGSINDYLKRKEQASAEAELKNATMKYLLESDSLLAPLHRRFRFMLGQDQYNFFFQQHMPTGAKL